MVNENGDAQNGEAAKWVEKRGLTDVDGSDCFNKVKKLAIAAADNVGLKKKEEVKELAKEYAQEWTKHAVPEDQPYIGAQPLLLKEPNIVPQEHTDRVTAVACRTLQRLIKAASGVHVTIAQDASQSPMAKALLEKADDESPGDPDLAPTIVSMANDWLETLPWTEAPCRPDTKHRLLIYIGTPGKYLSMCIKSYSGKFDAAYKEDRLVILCKGVCMLPLGTQEQNIFGVDEKKIIESIATSLWAHGPTVWGHGKHNKASLMQKAYGYPIGKELPAPLAYQGDAGGSVETFDYLVDYVRFINKAKLAKPSERITVYYDTGLLVSVLMGRVVQSGVSLLMDRDGLAMLRDASIGHIISKMNQLVTVEPYSTTSGVYNFFIGDGACRLNGGVELAMHLMQGHKPKAMVTLFVFNNHKWAIEDNLVAGTEKEHVLHNSDFYDLIQGHPNVCVCGNDLELRETLSLLSRRTDAYLRGETSASTSIVVIRGLDVELPPVIGDLEPIRQSSEMGFMREVLGKFAEGCHNKVPLYGCSAFEYIQYLHLFMEEMPEGKKYQYVCGRTDIQAAHMCGFEQPEGRCVLFINDVYGVNSLGESLRMVLSGFGGKQLLVVIWHPSLLTLIDHFHLHRPPMVWPSLGSQLCKYYVRKESDALFVDFEGGSGGPCVTRRVTDALDAGTPLVVVNVLPVQERDYVSLDIRCKT